MVGPRARSRIRSPRLPGALAAALLGASASACTRTPNPADSTAAAPPSTAAAATGGSRPLAVREGLNGPEAVRYDADQDVYFVSNWDGDPSAADNNGFISRLRPDGAVDSLRFVAGGARGVTLHSPRGMTVAGDTLWVADLDAVRGFDRRSGAPLASVAMARFEPGFLNDVAVGPDGAVYVTDTGKNRIYRVSGGRATIALADSALGSPNGITWDAANSRFLVVPYGGAHYLLAWRPGTTAVDSVAAGTGAKYDGVELLAGGRVLVASQADSSLHLFTNGQGRAVIHTSGPPADIGVDSKRGRVAVPSVGLNSVEIYEIPKD
jgi:sugar lactone lactonase YvrE